MSHNTTSWKSHTSTWRWTAGKDGRTPEGGKARQIGGRPALARQKAIREHDQREMAMQAIPAPALVMGQATLTLGVLIELLDGPAAVGQFDEALQRRVLPKIAAVPLHLAACPRHRAFAEQPALRSRPNTRMARRKLRAPCGPVGPHGDKLFAQDHAVTLAPGDRLPAVLWQGIEHSLGLRERGGARLLRLTAPPRTRWGPEGCRVDFGGQTHPEGAADAHDVGDVPVVEALGRVPPACG